MVSFIIETNLSLRPTKFDISFENNDCSVKNVTIYNGGDSHHTTYYDQSYVASKSENGRPSYVNYSFHDRRRNNIAYIKYGDYAGEMAWIVRSPNKIRFVSFSDVDKPSLATDWKYRTNIGILRSASNFSLREHGKLIVYNIGGSKMF